MARQERQVTTSSLDPVSRGTSSMDDMGGARVRAGRPASYARVQVALHWLVAALVLEQYATSGAIVRTHTIHMIGQRQSPADLVLHAMHNRLGLLLTALMAVRLGYRLWVGAPTPLASRASRAWTRVAASTVHAAFYAVLIAEGVAGAVASYLWWPASALHVVLFKVLLALLGLHVAAVVLHHLSGSAALGRMGLRWVPALGAVGGRRHEETIR
jgi:cytochrome b561